MKTITLFDEKALRERIDAVYRAMATRAKPKVFKNGRRKGQVRVPGIVGLPFTRQQLWDYAFATIGPGVLRCPYCVAIGRNATLITLANCVFDHVVPVGRGGTWELSNIRVCCADCNNLKGQASYLFFVAYMAAFDKWPDAQDRAYIYSCLRSHGVTRRIQYDAKAKPQPEMQARPTSGALALQEDF